MLFNPWKPLEGMKTGPDMVENSLAVPQWDKHRTADSIQKYTPHKITENMSTQRHVPGSSWQHFSWELKDRNSPHVYHIIII